MLVNPNDPDEFMDVLNGMGDDLGCGLVPYA